MGGGELQLIYKAEIDSHFVGNPQMTFFKYVYRKYTNFAIETLDIKMNKNQINETEQTQIHKIKIPRDADLLSNLYLSYTLPNIYSGSRNGDGNEALDTNNVPYEFRWVENIGTNLIKNAKLLIDTAEINTISGKFMQVLSEINYDDSKKKIYDEMTGNVPEVYDPQIDYTRKEKNFIPIIINQGTGYVNSYPSDHTRTPYYKNIDSKHDKLSNFVLETGAANTKVEKINIINYDKTQIKDHYRTKITSDDPTVTADDSVEVLMLESYYPHIMGGSVTETTQHKINNNSSDDNTIVTIKKNSVFRTDTKTNYVPSIKKRNCRVPLPFYFTKNPGLSIPLVALQRSEIMIDLDLNPVNKLYTILKYFILDNPITLSTGPRCATAISKVTTDDTTITLTNPTRKLFRIKPESDDSINTFLDTDSLNLDLKLEGTFVYLDNDEKKRFAISKHEYLIEEYHIAANIGNNGVINSSELTLNLNYPVKELIVVSQRNDMLLINNWNNYTNWTIENVAPYSERYNTYERMYATTTGDYVFYNKHTAGTTDDAKQFNMRFFKENIIENLTLNFHGQKRHDTRNSEYFNLQQPFEHHKRKIKKGIHVYSFSLNPDEYQPSGYCNFSAIDNVRLELDLGIETGIKELPKKSNGDPHFKYNFDVFAIAYNILSIQSGIGGKQYVT